MPRIRTIKPEYWGHQIMGRLDDASRAMGVALLNLADDEGYFHADPATVRNFARPFDDDTSITRRCITTLISSGWIEVRNHPEQGDIGLVVNFEEHQRIDRPKPSKIKFYFVDERSTNDRRTIDAGKERKGKEGKGKSAGVIGDYPEELSKACEEWKQLYRDLKAEYSSLGNPGDIKLYVATSWGSIEGAYSAWSKRVGSSTPRGKITHGDMLLAVEAMAEKALEVAQRDRVFSAPQLPTLLNSPKFVDALLACQKHRLEAQNETHAS